MHNLQKYFVKHQISGRISAAAVYTFCITIALNLFWRPAKIYSGGFTGLAQIFDEFNPNLDLGFWLFAVNAPMIIIAFFFISKRFAFFSFLTIILSSFVVNYVQPLQTPLTPDPIISAIFGGLFAGFGNGFGLRFGTATGGLDITSVLAKKYWNIKLFPVTVVFNTAIMLFAGMRFGWQQALYSILGLVVSSWIASLVFAKQQQMQVMIVTENKDEVVKSIQNKLRRGITIINNVHGGYLNDSKNIIFTVISQQERYDLRDAVYEADPNAFSSMWKVDRIFGRFYEENM